MYSTLSSATDATAAPAEPRVDHSSRLGQRVLARVKTRHAYSVRLATSPQDVRAAQALRFLVFNLELGEGLEASYHTCRDEDPYDAQCDHLLVECAGEVVGTYRLQTGARAAQGLGYYSAGEFDFAPFESRRREIVELGRACVAREHRNLVVLSLLWRGIASYAREAGCRYLIGCGSLTSQDEAAGLALHAHFQQRHGATAEWLTQPLPGLACQGPAAERAPATPKLLSAYLSLGAVICAPPAIDREFKTIDFLTLLDLDALSPSAQQFLA